MVSEAERRAMGRGGQRSSWLQRLALLIVAIALLIACSRPFRVGDYVLVEWGEEGHLYPAFIIQKKGPTRFRVHYEGYPARWDEDVTLERIKELIQGQAPSPPPPRHVQIATGLDKKTQGEVAPMSRYKVEDRIRVRWRGSIYRATVIEVVSVEKIKIRYDGHEAAWDEVIDVSRIATGP